MLSLCALGSLTLLPIWKSSGISGSGSYGAALAVGGLMGVCFLIKAALAHESEGQFSGNRQCGHEGGRRVGAESAVLSPRHKQDSKCTPDGLMNTHGLVNMGGFNGESKTRCEDFTSGDGDGEHVYPPVQCLTNGGQMLDGEPSAEPGGGMNGEDAASPSSVSIRTLVRGGE